MNFHSGRHTKTLRIHGRQRIRLGLLVARKSSLYLTFSFFDTSESCLSLNNDHRCQYPQITGEGLDDSVTHGAVRDYHLFCCIPDIQFNYPRTSVGFTLNALIWVIKWIPIQLSFVRWAFVIVDLRHPETPFFFLGPPPSIRCYEWCYNFSSCFWNT